MHRIIVAACISVGITYPSSAEVELAPAAVGTVWTTGVVSEALFLTERVASTPYGVVEFDLTNGVHSAGGVAFGSTDGTFGNLKIGYDNTELTGRQVADRVPQEHR